MEVHHKYAQECDQINAVLQRTSHNYTQQPWSLRKHSFKGVDLQPTCSNLTQLQEALALGHRVDEQTQQNASSSYPSLFLPHACNIPYMPARDAFQMFSNLGSITIGGDSKGRHVAVALNMVLHENLYSSMRVGGACSGCTCDGIFSEARECRLGSVDWIHREMPQLRVFELWRYRDIDTLVPQKVAATCTPHKTPVLFMQGGLHLGVIPSNGVKYFSHYLEVFLREQTKCGASTPVVFFSGVDTQAEEMDKVYPLQNKARVKAYNLEVGAAMQALGVHVLDFAPLTQGGAKSDGVHSLADVNVYKAMALLNAMRMSLGD